MDLKIRYLNIQELQKIALHWEVTRKIEKITIERTCLDFLHLLKQIQHWVWVSDSLIVGISTFVGHDGP
jgi:hypothetical protein